RFSRDWSSDVCSSDLALALALAVLALAPVWKVGSLPPPQQATTGQLSEPWSPERLQQLREEGRVVFVNMTADWCVTCKANERRRSEERRVGKEGRDPW